jgi:hypothetical protein
MCSLLWKEPGDTIAASYTVNLKRIKTDILLDFCIIYLLACPNLFFFRAPQEDADSEEWKLCWVESACL